MQHHGDVQPRAAAEAAVVAVAAAGEAAPLIPSDPGSDREREGEVVGRERVSE